MELLESEKRPRAALLSFPEATRRELLRVLTLPDGQRQRAIGELYQSSALLRSAGCSSMERLARALIVGLLREIGAS